MVSPIETLQAQVATMLATSVIADTTPHVFGARELSANAGWNRYIWVPTEGVPELNKITHRAIDSVSDQPAVARELGDVRESFEVYCHGKDYATAWAMRCNLLTACNAIQATVVKAEREKWNTDAWMQDGQCIISTLSLRVPTIDAYISLDTLIEPTEDYAVITATPVPVTESTTDLSTAGEALET